MAGKYNKPSSQEELEKWDLDKLCVLSEERKKQERHLLTLINSCQSSLLA